MRLYPAHDVGSTHRARLSGDLAATAKQCQRRNTAYTEARAERLLGLGVDLGQANARLEFARRLFELWRHHFAGPAPGRPEIDQHRNISAADVPIEIVRG